MAAIRRATVFNGAAPGVDTDILATAITPIQGSILARLSVCLTTSSVVNVTATDGTTTHAWDIGGGGGALPAATFWVMAFSTDPALSYNVQLATDGVIEQLLWDDLVERA